MTSLHAKDHGRYPVEALCRLFGASKQAYYKRCEDRAMAKSAARAFAADFVAAVRRHDRGIGGQKAYVMYRREFASGGGMALGRDQFYLMMRENGLNLRQERHAPRTTDSTHGLPTYPNLIKDFIPTAPNRLWVSDITYIEIWAGGGTYSFCYLSMILDAYTEEVVGWSVGPDLSTRYPLEALSMALKRLEGIRKKDVVLIHHSDRGVQYASREYVKTLQRNHISVSMTESGNPKDNPQAERLNNTFKNELLRGIRFQDTDNVSEVVAEAVDFYNNERPHMSIGNLTPAEAAQCCTGEQKRLWHSWRVDAIKKAKENGETSSMPIPGKCLPLVPDQGSTSGLRPSVAP